MTLKGLIRDGSRQNTLFFPERARSVPQGIGQVQADGGTRTASINGAFIALYLAVKGLYRQGVIDEWPIKDYLGAVSVGIVGEKKVLDLCYKDDKVADLDLNLVMTGSNKIIEIQGTAEGQAFSKKDLDQLIKMASTGIKTIIKAQKKILGALP